MVLEILFLKDFEDYKNTNIFTLFKVIFDLLLKLNSLFSNILYESFKKSIRHYKQHPNLIKKAKSLFKQGSYML